MERKGVGSSSISFRDRLSNGGTLVNPEKSRIEIELAAREAENEKLREEISMKAELLKERELEDKIIRKFMVEGNIGHRQILSVLGSESSAVAAANMTLIPKQNLNICAPRHLVKSALNVPAAADERIKFNTGANTEQPSISTKAQKKQVDEWSCDLCKIKTTCEELLKEHFNGKKHLSKEKALNKVQTEAAKTAALVPTPVPNAAAEPYLEIKVAPPRLPGSSTVNEVHVGSTKQKFEPVAEKCEEPSLSEKKEVDDWSCSLCNVITTGEEQLKAHLDGKKHKAKVGASVWASLGAKKRAATASGTVASTQTQPTGLDMELVQPPSTRAVASEHSCKFCNFTAKDEDELRSHRAGVEHLRRFMENDEALTQIQPVFE